MGYVEWGEPRLCYWYRYTSAKFKEIYTIKKVLYNGLKIISYNDILEVGQGFLNVTLFY